MLTRQSGHFTDRQKEECMCRSEEELVNIVIGEAVLSLADDYLDISVVTIVDKLKQMLKAETDESRRKNIIDAIQKTCLSPALIRNDTALPFDADQNTARIVQVWH